MQSEIVAWRDGVVERVHLQVGDTFDRGAGLVELEPLAEEAAWSGSSRRSTPARISIGAIAR
jgi:hypothetical protein